MPLPQRTELLKCRLPLRGLPAKRNKFRSTSRRRPCNRVRLYLELLEDRTLPAPLTPPSPGGRGQGEGSGVASAVLASQTGVAINDDSGNPFDTAVPITLDAFGSGSQAWRHNPGVVDTFSFEATQTGNMTVDMLTTVPTSSTLTAYDSTQTQFASGNSTNSYDTSLTFAVTEDESYCIQVAALGGGRNYNLALNTHAFDSDSASAQSISLTQTGAGSQSGAVDTAGDVDFFTFVAPLTGVMTVQEDAISGSTQVNALSAFLGDTTTLLATNSRTELIPFYMQVPVVAGQTYFVSVGGDDSTPAFFALTLTTAAAAGHSFDTAEQLAELPTTPVSGAIEVSGVSDYYSFVAPTSGGLIIQQQAPDGSTLDSLLTVYDGSQTQIARNDDSQGTLNSLVRFNMVAGETYFVEAGAFGSTSGTYNLTFTLDDFPEDFADAQPISVSATGNTTITGNILATGDVNMYQFVAPQNEDLTIRQDETGTNGLDCFLFVYDSSQRLLTFNDDAADRTPGTGDSRVLFPVIQGRTYYVKAAGFPQVSGLHGYGPYMLIFNDDTPLTQDGYGKTFDDATAVPMSSGFARLTGNITSLTDVDVFSFTAPTDGSVLVRMDGTQASTVIPFLYAFDSQGQQLATDYDLGVFYSRTNGSVQFDVQAGQVYHVQAASYGTTGGYDLTFQTADLLPPLDQFGHDFASATSLSLTPSPSPGGRGEGGEGAVTEEGNITLPEAVDVFQFTAPMTGSMIVRQEAAPGSVLVSQVYVFDDSQSLLIRDSNAAIGLPPADGTTASEIDLFDDLDLQVVAGKTYYIKATGYEGSTGGYILSVAYVDPNSLHDTFATALSLSLSPGGSDTTIGSIDRALGADFYQFVSPLTGLLTVHQNADNSNLDSVVYVYDDNENLIGSGSNDDSGGPSPLAPLPEGEGKGVRVQFNVSQGQTYFVKAAGYETSTGAYQLIFDVEPPATSTVNVSGETQPAIPAGDPLTASFENAIPVPVPEPNSLCAICQCLWRHR